MLAVETEGVVDAFATRGLEERECRADGDWVAISLSGPAGDLRATP
jgi:hypothetical protein